MRFRMPGSLVLSVLLHAVPAWWLWPEIVIAIHRPVLDASGGPGDASVGPGDASSGLSDGATEVTALPDRPASAVDATSAAALQRSERAREASRRLHDLQARTRGDVLAARARAGREAAAFHKATERAARAGQAAAEQADRVQTSAGRLRLAGLPAAQAAERRRQAVADQERVTTQAGLARDRAIRLEQEAARIAKAAAAKARRAPKPPDPAEIARVNTEKARADAAERQKEVADAAVTLASAAEQAARDALSPLEAADEAEQQELATAQEQRDEAIAAEQEAEHRLASAVADAERAESAAGAAIDRAVEARKGWVKLPDSPIDTNTASTLAAPGTGHSAGNAPSTALNPAQGPGATPSGRGTTSQPSALNPARQPGATPSERPSKTPTGAATGVGRQAPSTEPPDTLKSAGAVPGGTPPPNEAAVKPMLAAESRPVNEGAAAPKSHAQQREPAAQRAAAATHPTPGAPAPPTQERTANAGHPGGTRTGGRESAGTGTDGDGQAGGPLIFVRTSGEATALWNPAARFIGTQAAVSALELRAPTSTVADQPPILAIRPPEDDRRPDDTAVWMETAASAEGDPDGDPDGQPIPEALVPLAWMGRAPDGFALMLVDERDPLGTERAVVAARPTERPQDPPTEPLPEAQPLAQDDDFWTLAPALRAAATADAHDPAGSLAVLPEAVPEGAITAMSVSAHPLASWMNMVDEALRQRWRYPPEQRALGVEGTVELSFDVLPTGRVTDVHVTRADADAELVFAALSSVPTTFPAPPTGWGRLTIRYTYRYRSGTRP